MELGNLVPSRILIRIRITILFKNEKWVLGGRGAHIWRILAHYEHFPWTTTPSEGSLGIFCHFKQVFFVEMAYRVWQ